MSKVLVGGLATDTTDVTDDLFVINKAELFKITYPLHAFIIRCQFHYHPKLIT
ncbi:hypothetical protein NIES4071_88700 [Calothrix sp. NIES-4071]|nr:hypothetical protein NIES4071_88700 [Calothrix sp. NIES-4071]BAZ63137.1 hypothetical protein NIES4105_88630 [Calothrix sp. NIES-4105]